MSLSITISSVGQTSFTARVRTSGSVAMQHNWYLDGELYDTVQTPKGTTSSSCTFSGLRAGTSYRVSVRIFAFNPWRELDSGSTSVRTEDAPMVAETYYAKLILYGNGGRTPSGYEVYERFTGWSSSWSEGADITINFYDPGFTRTGYTLLGWSKSSSATRPSYSPSDSISIYSTRTSESRPATESLYAVWSSSRPDNWQWESRVAAGLPLELTASEWNRFIKRIQEFAVYKGRTLSTSDISAGAASKGSQRKASQARAVRSLISQLSPPISLPASPSPGDTITAAFVNGLKDSLNSIS